MPVQILQHERQKNIEQLHAQLKVELADCQEVRPTYRNKVEKFMVAHSVWRVSDLDYSWREVFETWLAGEIQPVSYRMYMKAFDNIKQHEVHNRFAAAENGRIRPAYKNQMLFLPYHPDQKIAKMFDKAIRKKYLVWDFSLEAPENMKRQIYQAMQYLLETTESRDLLRTYLIELKALYDYCRLEKIEDIEMMELEEIQRFTDATYSDGRIKKFCIVEVLWKALFLDAQEIRWDANVWYLERFHLQPDRINPASPVKRLSFLEVPLTQNRALLKQYVRYGLGLTNISISTLRTELDYVKNYLASDPISDVDIRCAGQEHLDTYFRELERKNIQSSSHNKQIMAILHFYNFLQVRGYLEQGQIPFHAEYYLKKELPVHHDRSVPAEVTAEILGKLYLFPEEIRLMYLHLWAVGLRISEVCRLKGDDYYMQGVDAWIRVYQTKMRNYKQIPIPNALYQLMRVYIERKHIKAADWVFQAPQGGPYHTTTFRKKMKECCMKYRIGNGQYLFRSHDYRHGVATAFYEQGVSIESIRDYLGHDYEEMTLQYIDYMPKQIDQGNEECLRRHNLASHIRKGGTVW